jgi:nucleoside phosphorylase
LRRDIFLHFLNRDTREVFDLYNTLSSRGHAVLLRRALNAAAILCEERCVAPPGFLVEDQMVFELAENQGAFLREGLIQLPMRESNLAEFSEKKRIGYEPMRDRYSGLFNDTRIGFLGDNATGIIGRKSNITERILEDWSSGPEVGKKIWRPTKKLLLPAAIDLIAKIPLVLKDHGTALTWSAIQPELPVEAFIASTELRDTLQHIYFRQYCEEFQLYGLTEIPHIVRDFRIPTERRIYSFRRLGIFLDIFEVRDLLLNAPADLIVALRKRPGFIGMIDAYAGLAAKCKTETYLKFYAGQARDSIKYNWASIKERTLSLYGGSELEIGELASVMEEIAANLTVTHGLEARGHPDAPMLKPQGSPPMIISEPPLVFFVALEEELDVLAKSLGLRKEAATPEAVGQVRGVEAAVICPRNMGRVAAAVAMSGYLAKRKSLPKLILIVGLAGGFVENKSEPGHVIVATKVVDLALRKVVDQAEGVATQFRREDFAMDEQLMKQVLSDDLDQDDWSANACRTLDWPKDRRPSIHFGPLASADEVVASDKWRKDILNGKGGDPKLLGVEMEAGGVCAAGRKYKVPVSMLRVITDQADPAKADDQWRKLGMATVADLLKNIPLDKVLEAIG